VTEVTPNLPHFGSFCKYCFMGTLLRGTPCCTYRYRMWIFQGASYSGTHPVLSSLSERQPPAPLVEKKML
jgi:hypothetical protein